MGDFLLGRTSLGVWGGGGNRACCVLRNRVGVKRVIQPGLRSVPARFLSVRPRRNCRQLHPPQAEQEGEAARMVSATQGLKINELRNILRSKKIKVVGRKKELVFRILEAAKKDESIYELILDPVAREEKAGEAAAKSAETNDADMSQLALSLVAEESEEIARMERDAADEDQFQPMTSLQKDVLVGVAIKLSLEDLKSILRSIQLPTSGAKSRVVARVISAAESDKRVQQRLLNLAGMNPYSLVVQAAGGVTNDLNEELSSITSVSQLTMDEIKDSLNELGLPTSGCKADLVMRLLVAQREATGTEGKTPQEEEMYNELMKVEGMTKVKLLDYMADRGLILSNTSSHMLILEKCKRWILAHYYGTGVRVKRDDFDGILNRQIETQNPTHLTRMEATQRAKAMSIDVSGRDREELIEALKEARKNRFPSTDASNIRIDALAQEWFLQAFQQLREGTFHEKIPQLQLSELQAELKNRGMKIEGEEDELLAVLLSVVSIEQGLSQKALGEVATTLIDRVYALQIYQLEHVMDTKLSQKPGVSRECRDVLLLSLVPRLLQIFDREMTIEKRIRQEITEMKYNTKTWEVDGVQHGSMDAPVTIGVLFEQDPAGASLASVLCLLDHLQTRKYHQGEYPENLAPNNVEDQKQNGIQVLPYLLDENQHVYRLTAASTFKMGTRSAARQKVPEDAVLVGNLQDWVSEIREVDALLPLLHGPLGNDGSLLESLYAMEMTQKDDPTGSDSMDTTCIGTCQNMAEVLASKHRITEMLREKGFPSIPSFVMSSHDVEEAEAWFKSFCAWCAKNGYNFNDNEFIVRPVLGYGTMGNSKLVAGADCVQEAQRQLVENKTDHIMIQKPIASEDGAEFNCWVVDTKNGPHALLPTEIEYPPAEMVRPLSSHKRHHTPPRMDFVKIQSIRKVAEAAFQELGLRDFACIHGVVMMDNDRASREKKILPYMPQPIPSGMYKEQLEPEDSMPGLVEAFDNVWDAHVSELDEGIEAWDAADDDPEVTKFREWLADMCSGTDMDPELILDPRPELKAMRERRPPAVLEEDFSETEEFMRFMGETEKADLQDVFHNKDFIIVLTDVEITLRFDHTNTLFQQAACIGLSQASILRHFANLALSRRGRPLIQPLQEEKTAFSSHPTDAFPEGDLEDEQKQDDGDEDDGLAPEKDDQDYYGRTYGMDDPEVESSMDIFTRSYDEGSASSSGDEAETEETAQRDGTQQIWVLSGGDGPGQQASFQSGRNAWQKLRRPGDLQVYHSVLVPNEYNLGKCERLAALLDRRKSFLEEGVQEEAVNSYEELTLEYIRNPKCEPSDLEWQHVVILDPVAALAPTLDDALEGANRRIMATNVAPHERDTEMVGLLQSEALCRNEFIAAEVDGVCGLWGGEISPCPLSITTNIDLFTGKAASTGAIVYMAIHGGAGEDGTIQEMLEQKSVLYTGSGIIAAQMCIDKSATRIHINSQADGNSALFAIDAEVLSTEDIIRVSESMEECTVFFENTCKKHGVSALVIKDNKGVQSSCVAKIQCPRDLQIFGQALMKRWPRIENGVLSGLHSPVVTLQSGLSDFVLEPYIHTGPYEWRGDRLENTGASEWILVTIGLLGGLGEMRALTPSLHVRPVEKAYDIEQKVLYGKDEYVTPVPESVCEPGMLQSCQKYIQKVGDILGLSGVAQVDAFLNCRSGEVGIVDVNTSPYLGPHSPLLQQGALEAVPLYPDDLYREVVIIAATPFSVEGSFDEDLVGFFEDSDSMISDTPSATEQVYDV